METETGEEELELRVAELVQAVLDRAAHSALIRPPEPERHQPEYPLTEPDWGSCRDFTVERGRARIEDYMRTWEIHPSWRYSISFLQERELDFQKQFLYRALWGRPTSRAPIPRSTAAVYFIITAPKTRDPALPVEVRFTVESNRTLHEPGRTRFREKWLQDVIESKALLIDSVDF